MGRNKKSVLTDEEQDKELGLISETNDSLLDTVTDEMDSEFAPTVEDETFETPVIDETEEVVDEVKPRTMDSLTAKEYKLYLRTGIIPK